MKATPEMDEAVMRLAQLLVDAAKRDGLTGLWLDSHPRILLTSGEVWGGRVVVIVEPQPEVSIPRERARKEKRR